MDTVNTRITPFPFPDHLAQFLSSQLTTDIEVIDGYDAKAIHIKNDRALCKMITRSLEKADRPIVVKNGITFYVSVSKNLRIKDKLCEEARFTDMFLSEESIREIIDVFESIFRLAMVSFVDGANFGNNYRKGKRNRAIYEFMKKFQLTNSTTAFDKYLQMYKREKKDCKSLLNKVN
jgi:hypothetical protein